jgi:DNA-binding CsgD family transcriptional regulator
MPTIAAIIRRVAVVLKVETSSAVETGRGQSAPPESCPGGGGSGQQSNGKVPPLHRLSRDHPQTTPGAPEQGTGVTTRDSPSRNEGMTQQIHRTGEPSPPGRLATELLDLGATQGWEAATTLWTSHWDRLSVEKPAELLDGLKALPGEVFLDNPGLVVAGNYLQRLVIDGDPARFATDPRASGLLDSSDEHGAEAQLILLTGAIAGARSAGEPESALRDIAAAHAVLHSADPDEIAAMTTSLANFRFQWGRTLDAADKPTAVEEYEEAYELAQLSDQPFLARRVASHLAWHYADHGRLNLADSWLARALSHHEPNSRYDAALYLAAALTKVDRRDFAGADVELVRLSAVPAGEAWAAALWVESLRTTTAGDATELSGRMAEELRKRAPAQKSSSADNRYIRMRLAAFEPTAAHEPIGRTPAHFEHFAAAFQALNGRRYKQALEHSARAHDLDSSPRIAAGALLIKAVAQRAIGKEVHAAEALDKARKIIDAEGLHTTYGLIPAAELHRLGTPPSVAHPRLPAQSASRQSAQMRLARLTARQQEVLSHLASDRPISEIADQLFVSPNTVKSSLRSIYATLGVSSRHEAAAVVRQAASL